MKKKLSLITCAAAVAVLFAIMGAAFLSIAGAKEFEESYGYFKTNAVFNKAFYATMAAGLALALFLWIFFYKKATTERILPNNTLTKIFTAVFGVAIIGTSVFDVMNSVTAVTVNYSFVRYLSWAFALLSVLSVYFTFCSSGEEPSALTCGFSFFPALFLATKVLNVYFDKSAAVNSPIKVFVQIAYIAAMLAFTAEAGLSLGRPLFPRYLFAQCLAVVIPGAMGLGGILLYALGCNVPLTVYDSVLFIAVALYFAGRLFACPNADIADRLPKIKKTKK